MSHEVRKNQILEATLELLLRHGPKKVSLDDIAERIGATKTAVYHYFPSKDEVIRATVLHEVARVMGGLEEAVRRARGPEGKLRTLIEARFNYLEECRSKHSIPIGQLIELDQLAMEARSVIWQSEVNLMAQVLQEGQNKGIFQVDDIDKVSEILVAALRGLEEYAILYGSSRHRATFIERIVSLFLSGLRASNTERITDPEGLRAGWP